MEFTRSILRSFCNGDDSQPVTCAPWSLGDYSYATNGRIVVRVARAADVPAPTSRKIEGTRDRIDQWLAKVADIPLAEVPRVEMPEAKSWRCVICDGLGSAHDCPDCRCKCVVCGGTGMQSQRVIIIWRGAYINAELWRLIQALPDARIAANPPALDQIGFAFSGGVGIVMPMCMPPASLDNDMASLIVQAEAQDHG